ncbi:MAG: hypothetical protein LBT98_01995 [Puniceicoccales bacterium]|nr:hypothetical protein [Puniceicoccales bacterium]
MIGSFNARFEGRSRLPAAEIQQNWAWSRLVSDVVTLVLSVVITATLLALTMMTWPVALCGLASVAVACAVLICCDVYLLRRCKRELALAGKMPSTPPEENARDAGLEKNWLAVVDSVENSPIGRAGGGNGTAGEPDSPAILPEARQFVNPKFLNRYVTARTESVQACWGLLAAGVTIICACIGGGVVLFGGLLGLVPALASLLIEFGVGVVVFTFYFIKLCWRRNMEQQVQKELKNGPGEGTAAADANPAQGQQEAGKGMESGDGSGTRDDPSPPRSITATAILAGEEVAVRQKNWIRLGEGLITIGQLFLSILCLVVRLDFLPMASLAVSTIVKCLSHAFLFFLHTGHLGKIKDRFQVLKNHWKPKKNSNAQLLSASQIDIIMGDMRQNSLTPSSLDSPKK